MTNVQFEEENQFSGGFRSRQVFGVPTTPGMIRLLGKFGIRDEKVAGHILIAVALMAATLAVVIFAREFGGSRSTRPPSATPDRNLPPVDPGNLF